MTVIRIPNTIWYPWGWYFGVAELNYVSKAWPNGYIVFTYILPKTWDLCRDVTLLRLLQCEIIIYVLYELSAQTIIIRSINWKFRFKRASKTLLYRTYAIVTKPGWCVTLKTLLLCLTLVKVSRAPTRKCAGCVSPNFIRESFNSHQA